jgi:hypothetical protein
MKRLVIWCLGLAIALGAVPATIAAQQVPGVDAPAFVAAQSLIPDADYWTAPRFPQDVARLLARGGWEGCR